jgi:PAS domain S-box-containing protein
MKRSSPSKGKSSAAGSSGSSTRRPGRPANAAFGRPLRVRLEGEQLHRRIIETTHEGIWMADLQGTTTFANPQMARMLGVAPTDMVGRPVFDFVFKEDHALVRQHFTGFLRERGGARVEERLRRKDGTELWALVAASVFCDHRRRPVSFLGMFTDITERKRAEQALRNSEARLQLQVSRMPIGFILWDSRFRVLSWNPAAERMFGFTEREARGKHPYDLIVSREVQPQVDQIWRRLLRGDITAHSVNANLTREGRTILCEWSNTPIKESGGAVVGVLSMVVDITERRKAEEALRQLTDTLEARVLERTTELQTANRALADSEEKYRRVFEMIADGAFLFDAETRRLVEVNEAALRLYGYTRKEFLRLKQTSITAEPEDSAATLRRLMPGKTLRIPLRFHRKKNGTIFPVEISASVLSLKGRPVACGIVRDITERKLAEEALRRREQELADFFADSPLGLLWVGPDGRLLRINQAGLELLGWRGEEVLGWPAAGFRAAVDGVARLLDRLARRDTVRNYRTRLRAKDGTVKDVLVDANGLWEKGRLVYSRWFVRDITRSVELEREILAITEQEQRRLGHDLHDDLCQQLAGTEFLSHALAGDLAARRAPEEAQAREIARMVQHAMNQTRDLARGLSPVCLEANGLTDALRELAGRTMRVFRIDCRFRCAAPVLIAEHTSAVHLYRIAQEAVGNAVKHGKARGVQISLAAKDSRLVLMVRDNGVGIPGNLRAPAGMGLQIMHYRAEAIGGSLTVRRDPRGGTSVICTVAGGFLPVETREARK